MLIIYLAITAVTFYVGGIYRNLPITVLFTAEVIVLLALIFQTIYSRRKISYSFGKGTSFAIKNVPAKREAVFRNNSVFTLSLIKCSVKSYYNKNEKVKAKKYRLFVPSGEERSIRTVVTGKYCGVLRSEIYNVKIRDSFGITGARTKACAEGSIIVLPSEKPLKITKRSYADDRDREIAESIIHSGTDSQEVHQLRLYQYGDPVKNIHRNMSARTDEIYYKEFKATESGNALLFIDLKGKNSENIEETDIFYELCSSVILGIFDCLGSVDVQWFNGKRKEKMTLKEKKGIKNILARLYFCNTQKSLDIKDIYKAENSFMFNTSLELYNAKKNIFTFSRESWEEQIKTEEFTV